MFTIGAGYLDILKTLNAALVNGGSVPAGTAMSPIASYNAATGNVTAVTDQTALWGQDRAVVRLRRVRQQCVYQFRIR